MEISVNIILSARGIKLHFASPSLPEVSQGVQLTETRTLYDFDTDKILMLFEVVVS